MTNAEKYFGEFGELFSKDYGEFLNLIPTCKQFTPDQIRLIYKALHKAKTLHAGQTRKSGEPYINHPIAVASTLANFGLDYETVVAGLLHDLVEDTDYTLEECTRDFESTIAGLVDGVTKIGRDVNTPTHKKILNCAKKDIRCIAIKIADRMHNLYTLEVMREEKQIRTATETWEFYVPITKILGIYKWKDALQDMCLYYLNQKSFFELFEYRKMLEKDNDEKLKEIAYKTQDELSKYGIAMSYDCRVKNVGSIYDANCNGREVDMIDDLLAIKMVLSDKYMCYQTLGVVHGICIPKISEMNDFIAKPKENGYKSLNTNVSYKDADLQVRIRTEQMQDSNNLGVFSDLDVAAQERVTNVMEKKLNELIK